jgi:pilus assembly protein Flp/PilA
MSGFRPDRVVITLEWIMRFFSQFRAVRSLMSESGVTAIEYGLIAALVAVAVITAVTLVGTNLGLLFTGLAGHLHT